MEEPGERDEAAEGRRFPRLPRAAIEPNRRGRATQPRILLPTQGS